MERGINVITSAEEMAYPQAQEPELAKQLDDIAKKNGVTVLGIRHQPWSDHGPARNSVDRRMRDRRSHRIQKSKQPVSVWTCCNGRTGNRYGSCRVRKEKSRGNYGRTRRVAESVGMICDALGWKLDKFEQDMEPIVTDVDRKSPYGFAAAGQVAGVAMKGWGTVDGEVKIEMDHPQQIEPEQVGVHTGDYVEIKGVPPVNMSNTPEIEGGIGTMAMIMNCIPRYQRKTWSEDNDRHSGSKSDHGRHEKHDRRRLQAG